MEKKDYLPFCRFYKGEEENPYNEDKDQNKAMLWFYEMYWVQDMIKGKNENSDFSILDEYVGVGLGLFEQFDGVPVTLKALLFNRYARTCNSLSDAIEPFKKFYKRYYKVQGE